MKKQHLLFIAMFFNNVFVFAQDMITTKLGEDIKAKILEVGTSEIKYKKSENMDGPLFSILKSDVLIVRYENGSKDIFANEVKEISDEQMREKGIQDAIVDYKGANSGATWTGGTALVFSPVVALIPALLCASASPEVTNLNVTNDELMKNSFYNRAYKEQAHKMKRKKVWKGFAIGSGGYMLMTLFSLLVVSSLGNLTLY